MSQACLHDGAAAAVQQFDEHIGACPSASIARQAHVDALPRSLMKKIGRK